MKRISIIIFLALPMWLQTANAVIKASTFHFGYVSGSVGYSNLSQNVENVTTKGDMAWLVGAGYEFRVRSFWLSVGAQYMNEQSQTTVEPWNSDKRYSAYDDQRKPVTPLYNNINQVDIQNWRTIDIPLMLGYYYKGFYVGGGGKVGFSMGSTITTSSSYDLDGDYSEYIKPFHNVNYYKNYTQAPIEHQVQLRPQFSIIGEIGYDVLSMITTNSSLCNVLKIGFYFEYGLRSVRPRDSVSPLNLSEGQEANSATVNPRYLSEFTTGKRIVPYYVGVKLTYMIGGSREKAGTWHKGCQCYGK